MIKKQLLIKVLSRATFVTAMLLSSPALFAQVKIGTAPTTIDANNNIEVESSSGNKLSVHKTTGKMTYTDGTQAEGKVLTSDDNGVASWQGTTQLIILGTNTNTLASPYTVVSGLSQGALGQRIPFTAGFGPGYSAATKSFILPADGYYRVSGGVRCVGTRATVQSVTLVLQDGVYGPSDQVTTLVTGSSAFKGFSVIGYYTTSSAPNFFVNNQSGANVGCYAGYLAIERIIPAL